MRKYKEKIMGGVFFTAALTSILAVLLICVSFLQTEYLQWVR